MAKARSTAAHGCYLYAIAKMPIQLDGNFTGLGGRPVYTLDEGKVAAVISDIDEKKIRPERRHIAAHQEVLRQLMAIDTVLPMAFGTVADSPKGVGKMLKTYQASFVKQLSQVCGKVEMGLRVTLDSPDAYEYLIAQSPDILEFRDRLAVRGGGSHHDKIELGRQFAELLENTRAETLEKIEGALAQTCSDFHENAVKGENEIANIAFLVDRRGLAEFEKDVEQTAEQFDDHFSFQYTGPWAPYNFVHIELDL